MYVGETYPLIPSHDETLAIALSPWLLGELGSSPLVTQVWKVARYFISLALVDKLDNRIIVGLFS